MRDVINILDTVKLLLLTSSLVRLQITSNPPYINGRNMDSELVQYISQCYAEYKYDFFSVFIVRCSQMSATNGKLGFLTPYVWMFIQSYEQLRTYLYQLHTIDSLIQFEYSAFEEATVPVCSFTFSKGIVNQKRGVYLRLTDFRGGMEIQRGKTLEAKNNKNCGYYYEQSSEAFSGIPGHPVAYWVTSGVVEAFKKGKALSEIARTRQGFASSDNNRFLRLWWEANIIKIGFSMCSAYTAKESKCKWFPCNKGGDYRKWYGNNYYVVNWENDGQEMLSYAAELYGSPTRTIKNIAYYFLGGMTWGTITSAKLSMRHSRVGFIPEHAGGMIPLTQWEEREKYLLGLMNSCVAMEFLTFLSPTLRFTEGPVGLVPVIIDTSKFQMISLLVDETESLSISDWDSSEISWDFKEHPFVWYSRGLWDVTRTQANISYFYGELPEVSCPLEVCWLLWKGECEERFNKLKANEEELNRIFIDIYGLQDELTPEVEDKDVTVRKADLGRDMRSFISYAVGCMFGRYSLDKEGLILAGQKFESRYAHNPDGYSFGEPVKLDGDYLIDDDGSQIKCTFVPDQDGIIPISDDEYFEDDIVGRFVIWLKMVFGEDSLEANLKFVADALGGKGAPRDVLRQYFLNDFYKDHLKVYQKRPIYWLFDSGKKNGFKCLIYMHRYQPDTIARIRTDYVHETQARYRNAIETLERQSANASAGEKVKLGKRLEALRAQAEEVRVFEEKIHHLADQMIPIDLDDGVKVNYAKFADVLAPIK